MHEAKRPRLTGSFSPASPPYHLAKGIEQTSQQQQRQGGFHQHPQTPTSPPPAQSMSSIPTTASTTTSNANTQLTEDTPASSIAGVKHEEDDADVSMVDEHSAVKLEESTVKTDSHTRTDHERIQEGLKVVARGSQEEIQDFLLNVDVGPLYKLCEKSCPQSSPHPTQNLFSLYNLQEIATTVARKDPKTGEKINKLRKSYEGKIKDLGISGRNKAVDGEGDFETLMGWPAEEYRNQRIHGKEIRRGLEKDFESRLAKAFRMPMPQAKLPEAENMRWSALLGTDEPVKSSSASISYAPQQAMVNARSDKSDRPGSSASGSGNAERNRNMSGRPERLNKKRSYHDSSFTGYGDSFDDVADGSDDEALSTRRKRMKA